MKSATKVTLIIITIVMFLYAISNLISCQDSSKVEKDKRKPEDQIKIKKAISDMVVKYGAVDNWKIIFEKKDYLEPIFTIHVKEALCNTQDRPILFYAFLEDIIECEEKYTVFFETLLSRPNIRFELQSNEAQVESLLKSKYRMFFDKFAVVALIEEVQKPKFTVEAYPISGEEAEIEIASSDIFIATGKCLDFLFVGDFSPDE
ncbi:MAG: hypothetical protein JXA50_09840 [Deltaproteobacteria bacterium]|nr:hypothetical protein [Deltaproteobacteria bacterium]